MDWFTGFETRPARSVLAYFDRPGTIKGTTEAIDGRRTPTRLRPRVSQPYRPPRQIPPRSRSAPTPTTPPVVKGPFLGNRERPQHVVAVNPGTSRRSHHRPQSRRPPRKGESTAPPRRNQDQRSWRHPDLNHIGALTTAIRVRLATRNPTVPGRTTRPTQPRSPIERQPSQTPQPIKSHDCRLCGRTTGRASTSNRNIPLLP
jgi:hypothetical protein